MPQVYAENLNYTHIGQLGDHVVFFEKDVPVVNLFGGDADGFNYYSDKIDNADSFKAENPNYGKTMADTASLVYDCLTAEGFSAAAAGFSQNHDAVEQRRYISVAGVIPFTCLCLMLQQACVCKRKSFASGSGHPFIPFSLFHNSNIK